MKYLTLEKEQKKDNSLKHKSAAIVYWAAVGFITVGYFFFITCVK